MAALTQECGGGITWDVLPAEDAPLCDAFLLRHPFTVCDTPSPGRTELSGLFAVPKEVISRELGKGPGPLHVPV